MNIEKKLREARFFLEKMREDEAKAFGDRAFEFYLSAFLNAGRTVDYRLCHEHQKTYQDWRVNWNKSHSEGDKLIKFFSDERAEEVHKKGSRHSSRDVSIPVRGSYSDNSGFAYAMSVPSIFINTGGDFGTKIFKQEYYYEMDKSERRIVDVSAEYLNALEQMLAQFQAECVCA